MLMINGITGVLSMWDSNTLTCMSAVLSASNDTEGIMYICN
jgi:hypothetical protein